jgi:hypothetical protein
MYTYIAITTAMAAVLALFASAPHADEHLQELAS